MPKRIPTDAPPPLTHSPFAKLAGQAATTPQNATPAAPVRPVEPPAPKPGPARAVVRMERKGRGGKEVTVVEQLALRPKELAAFCQALKQKLGCGGTVEGDAIVVQGDQRERVCAFLEARGVRKVIRG